MNKTVITFGTFDVFHFGHLRILERARSYGDSLVVGVSSDELNRQKKDRDPIFPEAERIRLIGALKVVDDVFLQTSLQQKGDDIINHGADILVMGDEGDGRNDHLQNICKVIYLPRTPSVSTTAIIERITRE